MRGKIALHIIVMIIALSLARDEPAIEKVRRIIAELTHKRRLFLLFYVGGTKPEHLVVAVIFVVHTLIIHSKYDKFGQV